jgi:hypothetical protein
MKKKLISLSVVLAFAGQSNIVLADPTNKNITREIANCYIGHERAETEYYKTGKAEELKLLIAQFSSKEQVDKIILFTKQRQLDSQAAGVGIFSQPAQVVKKYCTTLDEEVAKALN